MKSGEPKFHEGPATEARLAKVGVTTIGQLAESSPQSVQRLLGHAVGKKLTALAWNRDPRQIQTRRRARSAGAQSALGRRPANGRVFKPTLHHLADRIGARLRAKSLAGRPDYHGPRALRRFALGHALAHVVSTDFRNEGARGDRRGLGTRRPRGSSRREDDLATGNRRLKSRKASDRAPLGLGAEERRPGTKKGVARSRADRAIDAIRKRFGGQAVDYGSGSRVVRSVPDEFRRLAEREL
jgi:DNA polymerase-4